MIGLLVSLADAAPIATWDFEQDDGGLVPGGELGEWHWGTVAAGPGSAVDGTKAWAIGLDGMYLNDTVETLDLEIPDLTGVARPVLNFEHWYGFGVGDYGYLEVDAGSGYAGVTPVYGYPASMGWIGVSAGWEGVSLLLPAGTQRVRFVFVADPAGVGPGWFVDELALWDGDVTPPQIDSLESLLDTEDLTGPYLVHAGVEDDTRVAGVTLRWSSDKGAGGDIAMTEADGEWTGGIPAQPADTVVSYQVIATDGANSRTFPEAGGRNFRVYLPAPTNLLGPSGRVVANEVALTWTPPVSNHAVLGYQLFDEGELVLETTEPAATAPISADGDHFSVAAVYAAGRGDLSEGWSMTGVLPALLRIEPAVAYAGDTLRVDVYGEHAEFVEGAVSVDLGEGATTESVAVRDVDHLVAQITLDNAATIGEHTVWVTTPAGAVTLPGAFLVEDARLRPHLSDVSPDHLVQGESATLILRYTGALAGDPIVDLGEGVVVQAVRVEGDSLSVDVAVAINAPVGEHAITADDGVRRLDGVSLEVKDWSPPPVASCSGASGAPTGLGALFALATLRRRRCSSAK